MPRLRRADCSKPGIRRVRRGRGFSYVWDLTGERVTDPETLERIKDLVLPPAWNDVWVCPHPNGHLQAVGTDVAQRKQYRYHDVWRTRRDAEKFDEMLEFARHLPGLREAVAGELEEGEGVGRERVLACAVRLLDRGFFRIGAEVGRSGDIETFGLTTMRKDHVSISGDEVVFEYDAKGGKRRVQSVVDPVVREIVATLRRRRGGGDELLAFRDGRTWVDVTARDVNQWVKDVTGRDFSAKDFRTWNATVLAAVALAVSAPTVSSATARKRAEARTAREVADYLGNTPAVARSSYIDPRVFDRFRSGLVISGVLTKLGEVASVGEPSIHAHVDSAVLDLLEERTESDDVEKAAEVTALAS
jgi:DNA topoisomerase IB